MKKAEREEALQRIRFELAAFGPGSIFNKKASAVQSHIAKLEAKLMQLDGHEAQERRTA